MSGWCIGVGGGSGVIVYAVVGAAVAIVIVFVQFWGEVALLLLSVGRKDGGEISRKS